MSAKALAGLAILGVLAASSVGETLVPSSVYVEPQSLVAIDGARRLNLYCVGSGSPTVLLDAGSGNGIATWRHVQADVAMFTRVCAYDRVLRRAEARQLTLPRVWEAQISELASFTPSAYLPKVEASGASGSQLVSRHVRAASVAGSVSSPWRASAGLGFSDAATRQTGPLACEHTVERVGDDVALAGRQLGPHRVEVAGEGGLDHDRAGDVAGVGGDIHETDGAGERMADVDQGNRQGGGLDQPAQIVSHVAEVRRAPRVSTPRGLSPKEGRAASSSLESRSR